MINRVLIRIKVIQVLYSYLLVENRFALESQPSQPTKEKRFAYALYLEMLALIAGIAEGVKRRGGDRPLYQTRFIRNILSDEKVKSIMVRDSRSGSPFEYVKTQLIEKVKESGLYKNFLKDEDSESRTTDKIWQELFNQVIISDPALNSKIAEMENYSLSGMERMRNMMEQTFINFYASTDNLAEAIKTLDHSMDKARELYFRLLELPCQLTALREREIEDARNKFLASAEDKNPNMRFVENQLTDALYHNESLQKGIERYGRGLSNDDEPILRAILKAIAGSEIYRNYMDAPTTDFHKDCEFWRAIYKNIIFVNTDFLQALEDKCVFWNDDIDIIGTFVCKTIRRFGENDSSDVILPMYKDEEDARFGSELFRYVVKNKETYRDYINEALDKTLWETDRIAYMDVIIMMTAIAEILNFPAIPLSVSINEYIEIAKSYSTNKSGQFVNGLLGKIIQNLKSEGLLLK